MQNCAIFYIFLTQHFISHFPQVQDSKFWYSACEIHREKSKERFKTVAVVKEVLLRTSTTINYVYMYGLISHHHLIAPFHENPDMHEHNAKQAFTKTCTLIHPHFQNLHWSTSAHIHTPHYTFHEILSLAQVPQSHRLVVYIKLVGGVKNKEETDKNKRSPTHLPVGKHYQNNALKCGWKPQLYQLLSLW